MGKDIFRRNRLIVSPSKKLNTIPRFLLQEISNRNLGKQNTPKRNDKQPLRSQRGTKSNTSKANSPRVMVKRITESPFTIRIPLKRYWVIRRSFLQGKLTISW